MGLADKLKRGLARSREALSEIFYMGGEVDEDFWEELEDRLVMGDMGGEIALQVSDDLREQAALADRLAKTFPQATRDPFDDLPSCVLFVGINGTGKTTTVGKLASVAKRRRQNCLIGGADTFRAAAIEQLEVWGERAGVEVVIDDRTERPGVKFNDADLMGFPYQIVCGARGLKKGVVELKHRAGGERQELPVGEAVERVAQLVAAGRR